MFYIIKLNKRTIFNWHKIMWHRSMFIKSLSKYIISPKQIIKTYWKTVNFIACLVTKIYLCK